MSNEYWGRYISEGSLAFDPHQMFWHPREPHLFVSRDHRHITGWHWREEKSANEKPGYSPLLIADDQDLFSVGHIDKIFFSDSYNSHFLVKSESFWWWRVGAATDHWILYNRTGDIQSKITADSSFLRVFGDLRSDPLRPLQDYYDAEILAFPSSGLLSLCRVSMFPKSLYFPTHDLLKLQEFAKATINLANLQVSEQERIESFAWHPSGLYLAIEISGRLHLLHWDNAELVLRPEQRGEKYEAVAWSPDGTLLAVDRKLAKVWDVRTNTIRETAPHERWDYRPEGSLDNQLKSCDGLRSFSSYKGGPNFPIKDWKEVTDIAWSPDDPDVFATVGGKDCPRDIRIWQRVK